MELNNQIKISMNIEDIQNAIIYYLYREKNISGIFHVKFNIKNNQIPMLSGAEIVVDLNYKEQK